MNASLLITALLLGAAPSLSAQDCASSPLLTGRAAGGLALAHSSDVESATASVISGVGRGARLRGSLRATRLHNVDRLRHEGSAEVSRPLMVRGYVACPVAGMSYGGLGTARSDREGQVTTRGAWLGAEIGRTFALPRSLTLTPFVQPMLVHSAVSWRSTDAGWMIEDNTATTNGQAWLGLSLATSRNAVIARFRPTTSGQPRELALGVVASLGER